MTAHTLANLPRWAIALLLVLLFIVLPCLSPYLGMSELDAARLTAAASNDIEREAITADQ